MGFYGKQPVNANQTTVTYLWTGYGTPGVFVIEAEGDAQNYSYGFTLVRDNHFVGGLKIDVMGCTGPIGQGTTHYCVKGSFQGQYCSQIVISGSNGDFIVDVKQIPQEQVANYLQAKSNNQSINNAIAYSNNIMSNNIIGNNGANASGNSALNNTTLSNVTLNNVTLNNATLNNSTLNNCSSNNSVLNNCSSNNSVLNNCASNNTNSQNTSSNNMTYNNAMSNGSSNNTNASNPFLGKAA